MIWFWNFIAYSFAGFLLEILYARLTVGDLHRKGFLVLPLCPVYGLGAGAILLLPPGVTEHPLLLFLLGGLAATGVEYAMAAFYEEMLGVSFWNYRGLPGSIQGRVSLPFTLAWGVLAVVLVRWVHPALAPLLAAIPPPVGWMALVTLAADGMVTFLLLGRTGDRSSLNWFG